jgi:hypothetical protein
MARKRIKKAICPNCDFKFTETNNYCPNCGQENHTHKVPLKHYFIELLEGVFHFDTKIFVTLRDLLFKPGEITNNYNENKRARYVPPLRVYIFISFLFFVVLSLSISHVNNNLNVMPDDDDSLKFELNTSYGQDKDTSGHYLLMMIKQTSGEDEKLFDEYFKARKKEVSWYNRNIYKNMVKKKAGIFSQAEFQHKIYKNISYLMFFLMPLFALYLRLLYLRRKQYYSEHLVFSIHFHSILFILSTLWLLQLMMNWHLGIYISLIMVAYLVLSVRKVYRQSWLKTCIKSLILLLVYSFTISVMLLLTLVISAIF